MDSEKDRSEPLLRSRELRLLRDPSNFEFTSGHLDSLPSLPNRSRACTPSTSSSSEHSAGVEKSTRASSLQKSAYLAPFVTAQTWAITDGSTGAVLWGSMECERREIASLTKIMTCYLSLRLLHADASLSLETILPVSYAAASMIGTSARLREGDELHLLDALYGLMLPSGNDAAYCLAEFFGKYLAGKTVEPVASARAHVALFIREMNKTAKLLGLECTNYANPHGLQHVKNKSTAKDVGLLACSALKDPIFAEIVNTQEYSCYVLQSWTQAPYRKMKWSNTNRLLDMGWEGVKTGITMTAGPCLCASTRRQGTLLIVTVLGSKSMDRRWVEVPKLGKWALARLGLDSSPA